MSMNTLISITLSVLMLLSFSSCKRIAQISDEPYSVSSGAEITNHATPSERVNPYVPDSAEPKLKIEAGGSVLYADFEDNSSAEAFIELLKAEPITVDMHDYGNFEKVGDLGHTLPRNDTQITTEPGDVILYQGNQITIYYDVNTWSFTKLAHINVSQTELKEFLGVGNVTVIFSLG